MKKYAISDIHGYINTFESLLNTIGYKEQEDELYILGDLVDRGPDSRGVLDKIMTMQQAGLKVFCLRGNHEQMMLNALKNPHELVFWVKRGGAPTLRNFMKDGQTQLEVPDKYTSYLENLPHFLEVDNYLLVHAGFNFHQKNPLDDIDTMLWIRNWYQKINYSFLGDRIVIHGHTPQTKKEMIAQLNNLNEEQILDIDNGCCFLDKGMNHLCAFNMTDQELTFVPNIG